METVKHVLVPVVRTVVSARLLKGRHWTGIEHLALYAMSDASRPLDQLSQHTGIHPSVLSECILRLMAVGWVEIHQTEIGISFQATPVGLIEAEKPALTPVTQLVTRTLQFDVDCVTWTVHRAWGFPELISQERAEERRRKNPSEILMSANSAKALRLEGVDLLDLISQHSELLKSDERAVGYDPNHTFLDPRFAVTSVSDSLVEGTPKPQNDELHEAILDAASRTATDGPSVDILDSSADYDVTCQQPSTGPHSLSIADADIILGGPEHKTAIQDALASACRYVLIASTFIRPEVVEDLLDDIRRAARRGVELYLTWDSSTGKDTSWTERLEVPQNVHFLGLDSASHAKLLLADDGNDGCYSIVGSCNWFYSGFKSTEASIRLRSSAIVAECVRFFDRAVRSKGQLGELLREMYEQLTSGPDVEDELNGLLGTATLVMAPDHPALLHSACDSATESIILVSQSVGDTVEGQGLAALRSAANRGVSSVVYFQRDKPKSMLGRVDADELRAAYPSVTINQVRGTHAKLLCWDNDNACITSLNWLSKDAMSGSPESEIGIHVRVPGIGRRIREQYIARVRKGNR